MKQLVEFFLQKKIIFSQIQTILPKALHSRKKVSLYFATDTKGYYNAIISIKKKSRILHKEALELHELTQKMQSYCDCTIKKKHLLLDGTICSKAREKLIDLGWKIYDFS